MLALDIHYNYLKAEVAGVKLADWYSSVSLLVALGWWLKSLWRILEVREVYGIFEAVLDQFLY